ncbi:MAG: HesA/MoeB/ThiF family protein [Candidatus Thermoplasmatota archaeon]|jgi:adenylyltransferase/sulfurtransferase|nr:HesA/MoeB/ThiF family protein [Candidatus Thermoplasmatota archaeon]
MDLERYLSQISIKEIFPEGQRKIADTTVLVVGLGGTGSVMSELLVRMGIKKIILVDDDTVELSNLNRQSLYSENDVGELKVEAARRHLISINEHLEIEMIPERLDIDNGENIIKKSDIVLDGTDNYTSRGIINADCIKLETPWIFSAVEGTSGYVKAIIPRVTACLSCMNYPEEGEAVPCTVAGVLPSAVHSIGALASSIAIKTILGKESGNLYFFDVWKPLLESVSIERNKSCKTCGDGN